MQHGQGQRIQVGSAGQGTVQNCQSGPPAQGNWQLGRSGNGGGQGGSGGRDSWNAWRVAKDFIQLPAWDGEDATWEEFLRSWEGYWSVAKEAMPENMSGHVFLRTLPAAIADGWRHRVMEAQWVAKDLIDALGKQVRQMDLGTTRRKVWREMCPPSGSARDLVGWWPKWKRAGELAGVSMQDRQWCTQFDENLQRFPQLRKAIMDIQMREWENKASIDVDARYHFVVTAAKVGEGLGLVRPADAVQQVRQVEGTCNHCGQTGHWRRDCPNRNGSDTRRERVGGRDRERRGGGSRDATPTRSDGSNRSWRSADRQSESSQQDGQFQGRCHACGKFGHQRRDCPTMKKSPTSRSIRREADKVFERVTEAKPGDPADVRQGRTYPVEESGRERQRVPKMLPDGKDRYPATTSERPPRVTPQTSRYDQPRSPMPSTETRSSGRAQTGENDMERRQKGDKSSKGTEASRSDRTPTRTVTTNSEGGQSEFTSDPDTFGYDRSPYSYHNHTTKDDYSSSGSQ
jgi:hypothetical protein